VEVDMARTGVITFSGNPLTLEGEDRSLGSKAPNFTALNPNLELKSLSDFADKVIVISSVPSLDTPVCDAQTRRFNQEVDAFGDDVVVLTLSMDLPFAQKRWCGAAGIERVHTLSDHRDASFGMHYGLLIDELRLLARAVIVVDRDGIIRYKEIVSELTQEPNYEQVLSEIRGLLK
jgi:thiol peroxidase